MQLLTVVGARPQFVKASIVSRAIHEVAGLDERILHTGQHFDANMSDVFFRELGIPLPDYRFDIHGGPHGAMTARMLTAIEEVLQDLQPDMVVVYGDTNSTLAGALAAAKLCIPVAHVEAGLRSFDRRMPEEINRVLTDQLSSILYCPTDAAIRNLAAEGVRDGDRRVLKVGDVMQDAALYFARAAQPVSGVTDDEPFALVTVHRAENTDEPGRLEEIVSALNEISRNCRIIWPIHPRTRAALERSGMKLRFQPLEPQGYLEMLWLLQRAKIVLTDSGGLQKEAFFFGAPCVTLRDSTEWVELVECGANRLAGASRGAILAAFDTMVDSVVADNAGLYGGGQAATTIAKHLGATGSS